MIWLYIHLGISAITLLLVSLSVFEISHEFKRRFPHIKAPKHALVEHVSTWFRVVLTCSFPIINIAMLWSYLFNRDEIVEKTMTKTYARLSQLKENITGEDGGKEE